MINEVNTVLKKYLLNQLENPDNTVVDFSFDLPNKDWSKANDTSKNWINIYLLEIKENLDKREPLWRSNERVNNTITKKRPPLFVDLYYLITFYNKDKKINQEHNYLESTLLFLYDFKNLAINDNTLDKDLLEVLDLEIFPKPFIDENISYQLWSSLDQDARPYIPLKITLPLDSKVSTTYQVVREGGKSLNFEEKLIKKE